MTPHVIQNFEILAESELRLDALSIAEAGYAAIDTEKAFARKLKVENDELHIGETAYRLTGRRVFFVGIGKCAIAAARATERLLGDRLTSGIALDVSPVGREDLKKIEGYAGTHPLPSEANERATERIIKLLSACTEDDLVLMLISGGGSALLCTHLATMTCADESAIFTELTSKGAKIQDINTVRKHMSLARGGGLARAAYPAEVISLIISDVAGNDIGSISSGPTVRDSSTIEDAREILTRYQIPTTPELIETPKEQKHFDRVTNVLFLTNRDALLAMQDEATRRGYTATIMSDAITGEAAEVGRAIAETLNTMPAKTVLLYAGESTVTFGKHAGSGGRNQEMALSALEELKPDELMLPFASDGHDNTDHAGAIADIITKRHADAHRLSVTDYLNEHRSYDFFTASGDALTTGYTGSNVSDLIIAIKN